MGHKNNIKELLAEAFKELVLEYSFDKITIKMITDKVGVIRPTFYNHFADKYEVLEWICYHDIFEGAQLLIENKMPTEAVKLLFTKIELHKKFYLKAVKIQGQNDFEEVFNKHLINLFEQCFECYGKKAVLHRGLSSQFISRYYAKGLTFVIQQWLLSGLKVSAEEATQNYYQLVSHSLEEIVEIGFIK